MYSIIRLVRSCVVLRPAQVTVVTNISHQVKPLAPRVACCSIRTMAQTSITSFFKASPPKPRVKQEEEEEKEVTFDSDSHVSSPVSNGKPNKVPSKRPRLESSNSDSSPKKKDKSLQVSPDKKKKVKRQRIESSGSEGCESPPSASSAPSSLSEDKTVIKVEKTASPKTYSSPKSQKKKPLTEANPVKKKVSPKNVTKDSCVDSKTKNKKKEIFKQEKVIKSASLEKPEKESTGEATEIVPETEYNPSKPQYHPVRDACWVAGAAVPYLALARTLELIEATSARLKIVEILSNYLRSVIVLTPEDLLPSVYMCLNQLAPAYESLELGIAETYLMKAIGQCTGRTLAQVRSAAAKCGDLGQVAEQARATQRTMFAPPKLSVRRVFATLREIAHMSGHASVDKKINKIQTLYVACRHSEARYLIRSLEGKLRIGLAEQSVLQALALAATRSPPHGAGPARSPPHGAGPARSPPHGAGPARSPPHGAGPARSPPHGAGRVLDAARGLPPDEFKARVDEHALIIKTTYCECPTYERLLPVLLQHGVAALPQHCRLQPGVPLKPMLAHPTKQVTQVFDRFENEQFTCEWKYDGERAQIHVPGDTVAQLQHAAIFSRNQENNTTKYPDVLARLSSLLKPSVVSCVLDCEAVAYDVDTKQILPFQILSTRKRKDASVADIKVQVCVFVFDLLFLNGEPLVRRALRERRALLAEHFAEREGWWQFATSRDCSTVEEVEGFMDEAVRGSCEGLMVKALDGEHARYDIARRSHNWLKLKKDYLDGIGDTLDVVVVGAYRGRGKRAGVFGGFLLACYERQHEHFQSLCKIGTGFSDEDLQSLTRTLQEHVIDGPRPYYTFDPAHAPDVWVDARQVWEVRCADLSLSPSHRAAIGLVHPDKGISLRFPRFVRVRDDKTPEQASSAQQIADMYLAQDQVRNTTVKNHNMDEFY